MPKTFEILFQLVWDVYFIGLAIYALDELCLARAIHQIPSYLVQCCHCEKISLGAFIHILFSFPKEHDTEMVMAKRMAMVTHSNTKNGLWSSTNAWPSSVVTPHAHGDKKNLCSRPCIDQHITPRRCGIRVCHTSFHQTVGHPQHRYALGRKSFSYCHTVSPS